MNGTLDSRLAFSPYAKPRVSSVVKRFTKTNGDKRTLSVIAKYPKDGLYYLGKITSLDDPLKIYFPVDHGFDHSKKNHSKKKIIQEVNSEDIITYAGAAPWPNLQLGDFVLVKIDCQGLLLVPYFPGKIIGLPLESDYDYEKHYGVQIYTNKTVAKKRRDIVKITHGQYTKMTKELIKKHHHIPHPDHVPIRPVTEAPIPNVEGNLRLDLNPEKGDEILARWHDDGWYYYGIIVSVPAKGNVSNDNDGKYGVMDSTGQIDIIHDNHLFSDRKRDHFMANIKEGSYVIAEHPVFPHSYAPGQVTNLKESRTVTVQFYDGASTVKNLSYIYLTTKTQHDEDVAYIKERAIKDKTRIIARDDKDGAYYVGTSVGTHRENNIRVKFDKNGQEVTQCVHQVFISTKQSTGATERPLRYYKYVLASVDDDNQSYLPAKVTSCLDDENMQVLLCNKVKRTRKASCCFYINENFYFNAYQFYHDKEAKRGHEDVKRSIRETKEANVKARTGTPRQNLHDTDQRPYRTQQLLTGPHSNRPYQTRQFNSRSSNKIKGNEHNKLQNQGNPSRNKSQRAKSGSDKSGRQNSTNRNPHINRASKSPNQSVSASSNSSQRSIDSTSRTSNLAQTSPIGQTETTMDRKSRGDELAGSSRQPEENNKDTNDDDKVTMRQKNTKWTPRRWMSLDDRAETQRNSKRLSQSWDKPRESIKCTTTVFKVERMKDK